MSFRRPLCEADLARPISHQDPDVRFALASDAVLLWLELYGDPSPAEGHLAWVTIGGMKIPLEYHEGVMPRDVVAGFTSMRSKMLAEHISLGVTNRILREKMALWRDAPPPEWPPRGSP